MSISWMARAVATAEGVAYVPDPGNHLVIGRRGGLPPTSLALQRVLHASGGILQLAFDLFRLAVHL